MKGRSRSFAIVVASALPLALIVVLFLTQGSSVSQPKRAASISASKSTSSSASWSRAQARAEQESQLKEAQYQREIRGEARAVDAPVRDACTGKPLKSLVGATYVTDKKTQCSQQRRTQSSRRRSHASRRQTAGEGRLSPAEVSRAERIALKMMDWCLAEARGRTPNADVGGGQFALIELLRKDPDTPYHFSGPRHPPETMRELVGEVRDGVAPPCNMPGAFQELSTALETLPR